MSAGLEYLVLSGVSLASAVVALGLSIWLFWHKRARSDRLRNVVLLLSTLCLTTLRALDLFGGFNENSYIRQTSYYLEGLNVHYDIEPRINRAMASEVLECIFTNALLFVYTRMMLSLVYRPDLAKQTVVYRRLCTAIYSCYALIVAFAISVTIAWVYVLAVSINTSLSATPTQGSGTLAARSAVALISLLYTLALSILTCLISHDSRFSTGTMTIYHLSLTTTSASFIFATVIDLTAPNFSFSPTTSTVRVVLEFEQGTSLYDYIRSIVVAFAVLLVPFVLIHGFTKRQTRGRLSRWRRAAFGDAGPPYAVSDVESGASSTTTAAAAEKTRAGAVEVDSSPISEAAGRARAELVGEGPAELPADVEIAEMEAGKAPGESAYVKATKGYDAEVLESAEERAKTEAD